MAQAPSFVATLGPRAKYDPVIDKEKFEKELVSLLIDCVKLLYPF